MLWLCGGVIGGIDPVAAAYAAPSAYGWRAHGLLAWLVLLAAGPAAPEVEASVLERARTGDARAFAEIVRHYEPRLRPLAYRLLRDRDRTDDVLQNAYVQAFRALGRFRGDASLGTWLYRITYNACLDDLRRNRRTVVPLEREERPEVAVDHGDPADVAAERGDLAAALARLSPDLRAAVILVDADGLDYTEAAKVLGVPPGTIGSRLNRARAALRQAMQAGS
jgi:RNA polymerase sigma-70 factor (ECF subfamily)